MNGGKLLVSQLAQMVYFSLWLLCFKHAPKPIQFVVPLLWAGSVSYTAGCLEHTRGTQGSCAMQGLRHERSAACCTDVGGACLVAAAGLTQELVQQCWGWRWKSSQELSVGLWRKHNCGERQLKERRILRQWMVMCGKFGRWEEQLA